MPQSFLNRTITQIPVTTVAGTPLDLVAAQGLGARIYVVTIVLALSAGGTVQFTEGTGPTALTGLIPDAANGLLAILGNGYDPVLQTNTANAKLTVSSVTGNAVGYIRYFIDS